MSSTQLWFEVPAAALSQRAYRLNPSFGWAPREARNSIIAWTREAYTVHLAAEILNDLPEDCIGDVFEFLLSRLSRKEVFNVATYCSSLEAQAWLRAVLGAAVTVMVSWLSLLHLHMDDFVRTEVTF